LIDTLDFDGAVQALARGAVVAVPTDTVYGLAASIAYPDAINELFTLKQRPMSVATPLLVHSIAQIEDLGVDLDDRTRVLAKAYWPGALTIVLAAPAELSLLLHGTGGTVGFRIPDDELLGGLLESCGPLAVTSANSHGDVPCTTANEVRDVFAQREGLAGVLDGGERRGAVSTVLDLSAPAWQILREGAISRESLSGYLD